MGPKSLLSFLAPAAHCWGKRWGNEPSLGETFVKLYRSDKAEKPF